MNDADGFRIEAALQFGFQESSHNDGKDTDVYLCTEAQLIAFAKACERKGMVDVVLKVEGADSAVSLEWALNDVALSVDELAAEFAPILEAERTRVTTEQVAWSYELACSRNWVDGKPAEYCDWQAYVTVRKPNVPPGSIRNLRPLYAGPAEPSK